MKNLLLSLLILLTNISVSQTLYKYDYVETYSLDWSGIWWIPITTTNYYTNASVSPTASAVLYGSGSGTSGYESDWYSFPNLVVDPNNDYYFTFRLASYRFTSTNSTRGVDGADYITVQLSTNGALTTIGPSAGGDRTSTGDGYSVIRLNIPPNTSNIAIDIFTRANAFGEEWWMDNFQLYETVNSPLPIELLYFNGVSYPKYNVLQWSTASEINSSHYIIERSLDGINWLQVGKVNASGNSTSVLDYSYVDLFTDYTINYYRLTQFDYDGKSKKYDIIGLDNSTKTKTIVKYFNLLGQEIDESDALGVIIVVYSDGTSQRIIK